MTEQIFYFASGSVNRKLDLFADDSKARWTDFDEFIDTEAMFLNIFKDFRRRKVIPEYPLSSR